jgi:hypothetical protein
MISQDRSAAIWEKGFQAFLNAPAELREVLSGLQGGSRPSPWSRLVRRIHRGWSRHR